MGRSHLKSAVDGGDGASTPLLNSECLRVSERRAVKIVQLGRVCVCNRVNLFSIIRGKEEGA